MIFNFKVLSALTVLFIGASATSGTDQCSGGQVNCCNSVRNAKSLDPPTKKLLTLFNIDVKGLTGWIGLSCSAVNVPGLGGGSSCSNQQVCCMDNKYNGIIAMGCSPIDITL